jgi:exopolysaccharide biosynthesis polyprenyl glycosylphosphotransferase
MRSAWSVDDALVLGSDDSTSPHMDGGDPEGLAASSALAIPVPTQTRHEARNRQKVATALGRVIVIVAGLVTLTLELGSPMRAFAIASLSCCLCLAARRVTESLRPSAVGRITRSAAVATLGSFAVLLVASHFSWFELTPWTISAIGGAAFALLALHEGAPRGRRILLVGDGSGSAELVNDVAEARKSFEIVATVGERQIRSESQGELPSYESIAELAVALDSHRPDLVVVNVTSGRPEVFETLLDHAVSGFRIVGLPEFYEHAFGRVPVAHVTPAWFVSLVHLYQHSYTAAAKRLFDMVVASVAIVIALPLLPVIVLLLDRPIFLRQVRVGQWVKPFTMYKFRTMRDGAETSGEAVFASVDDPRVTRVGRVLRKSRLDEFPQLWNVLIGEMSIVGPRPERPEFYPQLSNEIPWWVRRNMVKPGITGWAQINTGYADDTSSAVEKLSYDLWYIRHSSVLIDLMICLRTFPKLLLGSGAR